MIRLDGVKVKLRHQVIVYAFVLAAGAGALFAVYTITASSSLRLQPMQIAIARQSLKRHNLPPIVHIHQPPPPLLYMPAALPLLPLSR